MHSELMTRKPIGLGPMTSAPMGSDPIPWDPMSSGVIGCELMRGRPMARQLIPDNLMLSSKIRNNTSCARASLLLDRLLILLFPLQKSQARPCICSRATPNRSSRDRKERRWSSWARLPNTKSPRRSRRRSSCSIERKLRNCPKWKRNCRKKRRTSTCLPLCPTPTCPANKTSERRNEV